MADIVREMREAATTKLKFALAKPFNAEPRSDGVVHSDDEFDPWDMFPGVYGSYRSDFDECAIEVLTEIRDKEKIRADLGAEMFREMLCVAGFCDYGTSPRVCFWDLDASLLDQLIARWHEWYQRKWVDPNSP